MTAINQGAELRTLLSHFYLKGKGLEIGALHHPLDIPANAFVEYVDRLPMEKLREHYPELKDQNLVCVDILDDGEKLATIRDCSRDFIIANHMLEHCISPITTLECFLSKLVAGGIIYIGIPDKRFCFDKERQLTTYQHLLDDYYQKNDQFQHFLEWVRFVNLIDDPQEIQKNAMHLFSMGYSIHYHVWDYPSFVQFLIKTNEFLKNSFDILNISFSDFREEIITVLRKK